MTKAQVILLIITFLGMAHHLYTGVYNASWFVALAACIACFIVTLKEDEKRKAEAQSAE